MSKPDLNRKSRKVVCVATLTAAGLSFGLAACGGDSAQTGASSTSSGQPVASTSATDAVIKTQQS